MDTLKFWVQAVLPVVYDDSLSYYEFLGKVCAKINEVIEVDNKQGIAIQELQNQMEKILNGDVIKDDIREVLEEMAASGELTDIVREVLGENANLSAVTNGFYTFNNPSHAEYEYILGMTTADFYDKFDALGLDTYMRVQEGSIDMRAFVHYSNLSKRFDITAYTSPEGTLASIGCQTSNWLFLTSGVHGNEKTGIWGLYLTVKEILTGEDTLSQFIRDNYNIMIIPCMNPYGIDYQASHPVYSAGDDERCRYNENSVDLNRNYSFGWTSGDHSGTEAFSEPETQFVKDVVDNLTTTAKLNGMFCLDCHSFDPHDYVGTQIDNIVYYATNNAMDRNIMNRSINSLCNWIKKNYPTEYARWDEYPNEGKRPVSARNLASGGTLSNWLYNELGYQHTFLFESPTAINGVYNNYTNWYKQVDLDIAYQTCKMMVCCTAFEIACQYNKATVYSPATYGRTLTGIQSYTVSQIVSRMADGSNFTGILTDTTSALSGDLPTSGRGIYNIIKPASNSYIKNVVFWYPLDSSNVFYRIDTSEANGDWKIFGHANITGDEINMLDYQSMQAFITALMANKRSAVFTQRFATTMPSFTFPGTTNVRFCLGVMGRNKVGTTDGMGGIFFVADSDSHLYAGRASSSGVASWLQLI